MLFKQKTRRGGSIAPSFLKRIRFRNCVLSSPFIRNVIMVSNRYHILNISYFPLKLEAHELFREKEGRGERKEISMEGVRAGWLGEEGDSGGQSENPAKMKKEGPRIVALEGG